jgi:acyl-CoA thioester hydrolase
MASASRHESTYRVRFDEAGPDGLLRASGLLRYAQDVAWMHSEALGFDRAWYRERDLAWLVRAAEVEVTLPISMGSVLTVTTEVVGYRKVWARRRAEFLMTGVAAASVITDWVLIDGRGRLTRLPEVFAARFPGTADVGGLLRVDLPTPPPDAARRSFAVRRQELDPMDHVNNAVYLDWLEESIAGAAPDGRLDALPRVYRLEYAASAEPDATIAAITWRDGGRWAHRETAGATDLLRAHVTLGGPG